MDQLSNSIGTVIEVIAPDAIRSLLALCESAPSIGAHLFAADNIAHYNQVGRSPWSAPEADFI